MERIIIKHLNGARANQEESFALNKLSALTFGRDPSCNVAFDPNLDVVSRTHARIEPDAADPGKFSLIDNRSMNGVFVNGAKIAGPVSIRHGDVVRLGPGGPEFQFSVDPPPADALKATRIVELGSATKPTREAAVPATVTAAAEAPPRGVGRETVERMLASVDTTSRKRLINWVAGVVGVLVLVTGGLVWYQKQQAKETALKFEGERKQRAAEDALKFDPTRIAAEFGGSTVYIEASWKLIDSRSKKTVHHQYTLIETNGKDGKKEYLRVPLYIRLPNGVIEPKLILDDQGGRNVRIGGSHTGSGFVVTENGFIMTNRHVAASWLTVYGDYLPMPGILITVDAQFREISREAFNSPESVARWVPARNIQGGGWDPKNLVGETQYLNVTFAKSKTRIPARIANISPEADATLIKIDTPKALKPVQLASADSYEELKQGEPVVVLGYPGVSPEVFVRTASKDPFVSSATAVVVPDNTVSAGAIGRLIRGTQTPAGGSRDDYLSTFGDMYQLTINSTGAGNSGGPAFDAKGRVIGIFSAGGARGGAAITFAVPIKYGIDLMDPASRVIK